jgi:hypothetical protein
MKTVTIIQDQDNLKVEYEGTHEHIEYRMHGHIRTLTVNVSDEVFILLKEENWEKTARDLLNNY